MKHFLILITLGLLLSPIAYGQDDSDEDSDLNLKAFAMRNIGPAFTSGRIADIAIHPDDDDVWFVAVGSGGVWKTSNSGTTWQSLFDGQGSYSTGALTLDPQNPNTVWVGTGENVGGRHVAYGDGMYVSHDGGSSWTKKGLEASEHISKIIVHPDNSDVIWVASQGPLWSPGGERGVFKSTDGGDSWTRTLGDDEWVGATDLLIDPRNPNILYAATWQRHRNVASYMGGGPGSGIHKSTDGGVTWEESSKGLPSSNLGKIGLAISSQNPDHVYAAIELDRQSGGVFMSSDRGASWSKMSDTVSGGTGAHYYQELYASPHVEGRLYLMDVRVQVSDDHGKSFRRMTESDKHSDNHAIAFREDDPNYILMGTDGGLFETFDNAATWHFIENLPVTQYYKVAVDDAEPFYNVFGGTQDNGSHGGPSRTDNRHGIRNADWFKTLGSDGHQSAVEPGNPNIIYAETQQGGLHRIDLATGEQVFVQPQSRLGEPYERYNWDAPIVISPHDPATLYFGSYRVWKSMDRGDSWNPVSEDLTRNQERFELPIMGRVQSWDNAWAVGAMSVYNTISTISESAVEPGLLYAGTDDGLIQISEDDGAAWRRVDAGSIRGIPSGAFVNHIYADLHDSNVVYAALDNHKAGDFNPYLIKSTDRGRTWTSIVNNLPDRTLIWRVVQDHVDSDLLFVGTEFGIYVSLDGGDSWHEVNTGGATISFRDVTVQRRENDLVAASFGRGFFILDDYSPLRDVSDDFLEQDAHLFAPRDAYLFSRRDVAGGSQGASHYAAPNPEYGAMFTYFLKEGSDTLTGERKKREKEIESGDIPFPGWDALEAEINEVKDEVHIVIRDSNGDVINRVNGKTGKGFHRVNWNLRHASAQLIDPESDGGSSNGYIVAPGTYSATLEKTRGGVVSSLSESVSVKVTTLHDKTITGASAQEIDSFRQMIEDLRNEMTVFSKTMAEQVELVEAMQTAHSRASSPSSELTADLHNALETLKDLDIKLGGYASKREIGERNPPSPMSRLFVGVRGLNTTYGPTEMHRATVATGRAELAVLQQQLDAFLQDTVPGLRSALTASGAPPIHQ
ncbi:MAG: glycosyl hydrolase [Rhodothermales bacterium]|nr:glycosyl hydrolase [Rhodothermales bacterium]